MKTSRALLVALSACSDPPAKPDASIDAPKIIDARAIDAGVCGTDVPFTGELVDWDSTEAQFCGVLGATWTVRGSSDPKETHTSNAPNGRIVMCIPSQSSTTIDITVPAGNSPCAGTMTSGYAIRGIAMANATVQAMIPATDLFSARAFTTARQTTFYTQIGAAFDPAKGGLFVHVAGTPKAVSIDVAHDATQAFDGTTWAAGASGADVYFPNVPAGAATITATGAIGGGPAPIEANAITYVTIVSP